MAGRAVEASADGGLDGLLGGGEKVPSKIGPRESWSVARAGVVSSGWVWGFCLARL